VEKNVKPIRTECAIEKRARDGEGDTERRIDSDRYRNGVKKTERERERDICRHRYYTPICIGAADRYYSDGRNMDERSPSRRIRSHCTHYNI